MSGTSNASPVTIPADATWTEVCLQAESHHESLMELFEESADLENSTRVVSLLETLRSIDFGLTPVMIELIEIRLKDLDMIRTMASLGMCEDEGCAILCFTADDELRRKLLIGLKERNLSQLSFYGKLLGHLARGMEKLPLFMGTVFHVASAKDVEIGKTIHFNEILLANMYFSSTRNVTEGSIIMAIHSSTLRNIGVVHFSPLQSDAVVVLPGWKGKVVSRYAYNTRDVMLCYFSFGIRSFLHVGVVQTEDNSEGDDDVFEGLCSPASLETNLERCMQSTSPHRTDAYVDHAVLLFTSLLSPKEALKSSYEAWMLEPKNKLALNNYAVMLASVEKNPGVAMKYLESILEMSNEEKFPAYVYGNLGHMISICDGHRDLEAAKKHMIKALEIDPKNDVFWTNYGKLLMEAFGEFPDALECFIKALEIRPRDSRVMTMMGILHHVHLKDFATAAECYENAVRNEEDHDVAHNNLGLLHQVVFRDYDKAQYHYEKAIEVNPGYDLAYCNLGYLLSEIRNDIYEARKAFKKAIRVNPRCDVAHNNLGRLYQLGRTRDYELSREHFEKAIEINPEYDVAHVNLAILLTRKFSDTQKARRHYDTATELNPQNPMLDKLQDIIDQHESDYVAPNLPDDTDSLMTNDEREIGL
eukprot:PhF_6_TR27808/c0_g1_i1/m.40546